MLTIDVISDVICPWCFIGKRRLEKALSGRRGARPGGSVRAAGERQGDRRRPGRGSARPPPRRGGRAVFRRERPRRPRRRPAARAVPSGLRAGGRGRRGRGGVRGRPCYGQKRVLSRGGMTGGERSPETPKAG